MGVTALVGGLLGSLVAVSAGPAAAGPPPALEITVTTEDDVVAPGEPTSLREAISLANAHDGPVVVHLPNERHRLTRCGAPLVDEDANATGDLDHTSDFRLTLVGPAGIAQTCPDQRVLEQLDAAGGLELQALGVTGGNTQAVPDGDGGGIRSAGSVVLTGSRVDNNRGGRDGGGIHAGGSVTIDGGHVMSNRAVGDGAGIHAPGNVTVDDATVSVNLAAGDGGGIWSGGTVALDHDVLVRNTSGGDGGAVRSASGVSTSNTNLTRNQADHQGGGIWSGGALQLASSTLMVNRAADGAHLAVTDGTTSADRSVVALGSGGPDCLLSPDGASSGGGNVGADPSCHLDAAEDRPGLHPMLQPQQAWWGTELWLPTSQSPVVDLVSCVLPDDQRGDVRPQGSDCESGAIEAVPPACAVELVDVPPDHTFYDEVCWLSDMRITTTGLHPEHASYFVPDGFLSRQAMAAFLYRLAGSPPFQRSYYPSFPDLGPAGGNQIQFVNEVEWLIDEGIAGGYADGTFRPHAPVTRQSMSAFLFRMAGEPGVPPPGEPTFDDVAADDQFAEAIEWMAASGVSTGYDDGTFRPLARVSRQAMAAFLHRLAFEVELAGI